jgi:hypothetical protein
LNEKLTFAKPQEIAGIWHGEVFNRLWSFVIQSLEESFAARALPPFEAPSLPSATAAGFFFLFVILLER